MTAPHPPLAPIPMSKKYLFSKAGIEWLKTNQRGVYAIYNSSGRCVYIGKGDIRQRLLDHLNGGSPLITLQKPKYWSAQVSNSEKAMLILEKKLILALAPAANQRVG